MGIIWEVLGRI